MAVHRFAIATAIATFILLFFGGLVSTTESGLACPDWPLCEGEFFPRMVDGKQFEHGHRLVASFVGAMTFGLTALLWKHRRRQRKLMALGVAAAVLVTIQALLGAITVWMKLPWWVSSTHLGTSMIFFAVAITLAFWTAPGSSPSSPLSRWPFLWAAGLMFVQIVFGALMRHLRGGLVCGFEWPSCLGTFWPLDGHVGVQLHLVHRWLGVLAGLAVLWLSVWLWKRSSRPVHRWLSAALSVGVVLQVLLGIFTVLWSRELVTMSVHSSLAAALLAGLVSLYWLVFPADVDEERPQLEAKVAGTLGAA